MSPTRNEDEGKQVAIRFSPELYARLKAHVERMNREHPGLDATIAVAVRTLLTRALNEVEAGEKQRNRKGSR